ncbi:MAG: serine/threonine-protein kinase [Planctomycetaceae bacterium]
MSERGALRTPESTRAFKPARENALDCAGQEKGQTSPSRSSHASLTAADLSRADLTGLRLGHYVLGPRIGSGGMGQVFVGKHETLGKQFAMKFMAEPARACSEGAHRFQLEIESLGRLSHPNIVSAVDAGCVNGVHYLVTELVTGKDLSQVVANDGPMKEDKVCDILLQVAAGLAHAHSYGFVHRDIKPSNLIVDEHGVVRILDFGLVRSEQHSTDMTCPGLLMGTIDFLSPEQAADGRMADHRSDLYSLGCTLLFLLTGKVPYSGDQFCSMPAKIHGHLFVEPPALSNGDLRVSSRMQLVLARLLQKRPEDRFQSANEVMEFLKADNSLVGPPNPVRTSDVSHREEKVKLSRRRLYSFVGAGALLLLFAAGIPGQSKTQRMEAAASPVLPNAPSTFVTASTASPIEPKQEVAAVADESSDDAMDIGVEELPNVETVTTVFRPAESGRVLNRMASKFMSGKPGSDSAKNGSTGLFEEQTNKMKGNE